MLYSLLEILLLVKFVCSMSGDGFEGIWCDPRGCMCDGVVCKNFKFSRLRFLCSFEVDLQIFGRSSVSTVL